MENASEWAQRQFGGVALGDRRRERRAVQMAERMAREPLGSLPVQMGSWEAQKGAYRLLDNASVSHAGLSEPHWHKTWEESGKAGSIILMVQDFTKLDYVGHPATAGLGGDQQRGHGWFVGTQYIGHTPSRQTCDWIGLSAGLGA